MYCNVFFQTRSKTHFFKVKQKKIKYLKHNEGWNCSLRTDAVKCLLLCHFFKHTTANKSILIMNVKLLKNLFII